MSDYHAAAGCLLVVLLLGCDPTDSTGPSGNQSFVMEVRADEQVTVRWGRCPDRPAESDIRSRLEHARTRAHREIGIWLAFHDWRIDYRPGQPGTFISSNPPAFEVSCTTPALAHEPGHIWADQLGLPCWRNVWHEVDLACKAY